MRPDDRAMLLSIRPQYAEMLIAGTKTIELRRTRPGIETGSLVVLYASSPACELVATARVTEVHSASADEIWATFGSEAGIGRLEYDAYFEGAPHAVAIRLDEVERLSTPQHLSVLRTRIDAFRPPQSFRYLTRRQVAALMTGQPRARPRPRVAQ